MNNYYHKMAKIKILFAGFVLLFSTALPAQTMEVSDGSMPPLTPENLITNVFLGDGVEVLSVEFNGIPSAVGYFTKGQNKIDIERGILMTSGRAASDNCSLGPFGANCVGSQFASTSNLSTVTDPDLQSIAAGGQLNDVAKYTITFIPNSDTLRFNYVFASEEYPEFACSSFNDVFGFFISGPGINGPYQNGAINIARIPGTTLPVTINNVHPQNGASCPPFNAQHYNDNMNSNNQPVYDGFLNVFTAEAIVIPCEIYTIKLCVADVGDSAYDTGVFLEAKSFSTNSLQVSASTPSSDGTITEGCAGATLTFSFPNPIKSNFPLDFTILGTATNGIDYTYIPSDLFISQGESSLTLDIFAFEDGIDEGLESIGIDIQRDPCNRDTFWLFIRENTILPPDLGLDTTLCKGDEKELHGTLPIPLPEPLSFTNDNHYEISHLGPTYSPVIVAGVQPITLGPNVIKSVCVNIEHKWVDDLSLFLISPGGQFLELSSNNGSNCDNYNQVCFSPTATTPIDYLSIWPPCASNIEAPFSGGAFQPEGVWEDLYGDFPTNGTWQLLMVDRQAGFNGALLDWTITFEPQYQVHYQWAPSIGLSCDACPEPIAIPDATTTYVLTASDTYGCEVSDTITIEVKDVLPAPNVTCADVTQNSIAFNWNPIPGAIGYQVNVEGLGWIPPNNGDLSHFIGGLTLDDSVTIQVQAVGECNGLIGTITCYTPSCDAATLTLVSQTNVSCNGEADGSLEVSAAGGAGGYVFTLGSITNSTGIFTGLAAGTYTVGVLDAWACPNSTQVLISEPDLIELQEVIVSNVQCSGDADGSATVEVTGGSYPYQFNWDNGQTDSVAVDLSAGVQTVMVTDANGCSNTLSFAIDEPDLLALNVAADSARCFGTNTGAVLVLIVGGEEPYSIQWGAAAGYANTALVENLPAGNYDVVVTDANACQAATFAAVLEPAALNTNISFQNPSCYDSEDGAATVAVANGTPGYSYLWSNGDTEATAHLLGASWHFVTVTDANGCESQDSVALTAPPPIQVALTPADAKCFGGSDGEISAQASGGSAPYTYAWSNGENNSEIQNLIAGNYCLTITDAQSCIMVSCIDVLQPTALNLATIPTNAGCYGGSEGQIDLSVSGGSAPYDYSWSNSAATEDISNLLAGTYSVTVTDAQSCSQTTTVNISESDAIVIQPTPTDVFCKGESTGSISVTVTGGSGSYSFNWTGPNGFTSNQQHPANLFAGTYTLNVTDTYGCGAIATLDVNEPASGVEVNIAPVQEICFGAADGTATATALGGKPPYSYAWSNGQTNPAAGNLSAGVYTVIATDGNGCQASQQVEIQQQDAIELSLTQTAALCHGSSDGSASVANISQGGQNVPSSNFSINWNPGGQTSAIATGLTGGQTYSVTVTNSLGCTAGASIEIGNPPAVTAQILETENVHCAGGNDGSALAGSQGGIPPFTYLWSDGQTSAKAENLPEGIFTVTVADVNGCTASAQTSVAAPSPLSLSFFNESVKCYGDSDGSSIASPQGGQPPYLFQWSNGDATNITAMLSAGAYTLTLTDANGCTLERTTQILQPSGQLSATVIVDDASCFGYRDAQIQIAAVGGTPPYTYSLDGKNFTGHANRIALIAGAYDVFVRDKNGCTFELNDVAVGEPLPIFVSLGADTIVLYNTHFVLYPEVSNAGSGSLFYEWNSSNPQTPVGNPSQATAEFTVTSPTTVKLIVTDENGCQAESTVHIFVKEIREIQIPTAFAPGSGGDIRNDLLHVHGNTLMVDRVSLFRVFDRWGELVYEASDFLLNDLNTGWDGSFRGKEMPAGVYAWYVEVEFVDGTSGAYKGHTTLIR